jgi:4'-phosphopantetheinyl transferase
MARDVLVRYRFTRDEEADVPIATAPLSADERERAARFVFARDRADYVAAHVLLRQTLCEAAGGRPEDWRFALTSHGKPVLANPPPGATVAFNLSHTRGLVACVVSHASRADDRTDEGPAAGDLGPDVGIDVGIDVEGLRVRDAPGELLALAARFFSAAEVRGLEAEAIGDRDARFLDLWTLKEAYIKAVGLGLSIPLDSFGFRLDGHGVLQFVPPATEKETAAWQFALFEPSKQHRLAVAIRRTQGLERRILLSQDRTGGALRPSEEHMYTGDARLRAACSFGGFR